MMNNNHQKPHCENNTYVINKYYIRGNSVVINSAEKGRGIEKQGISYTYDTLNELTAIYDARLYFVLGFDSVVAVNSWYRGESILKEFPLITALRPGVDNSLGTKKIAEYRKTYNAEIHILHMPPIDCSSSQIRELCRNGGSITGLVSENVEEYIIKNGLYKD